MAASIIGGTLFSPVFDMGVQLAGPNLWLALFSTGPVEWLWKSSAYNRRQAFVRAVAETEVMS